MMRKHAQSDALKAARSVGAQERGFELLTELGEIVFADPIEQTGDRTGAFDLQVDGRDVFRQCLADQYRRLHLLPSAAESAPTGASFD